MPTIALFFPIPILLLYKVIHLGEIQFQNCFEWGSQGTKKETCSVALEKKEVKGDSKMFWGAP